jgi:FtsP/CotA-like multicopper oxidase with cupredoxin domain
MQFANANINGQNRSNQIPYNLNFNGSTGDHIMVNGVPQPFFNVEPTKYLFRILVPGNSRKYFLRLRQSNSNSNITMVQVMQEAGITGPVNRTEIPVGIAERVGVVIDFAPFAGRTLILQNNDGGGGFGGSSQCVPGNCSAATGEVMQFRVGTTVTQQENINVNNITRPIPVPSDFTPVAKARTVKFSRVGAFWTLQILFDGRFGDDRIMDCARTDVDPVVDTNEEWTITNTGNWTHSIHIHDVDQRCVSRNGAACPASDVFKETWPVPPDTTWVVRLKPTDFTQIAFDPDSTPCNLSGQGRPPNPDNSGECENVNWPDNRGNTPTTTPARHGSPNPTGDNATAEAAGGRYMIHCHVIEHEDLGMMTMWRVKSNPDGTRNDVPH